MPLQPPQDTESVPSGQQPANDLIAELISWDESSFRLLKQGREKRDINGMREGAEEGLPLYLLTRSGSW